MASKTTDNLEVCESLIREHRAMEVLLEQLEYGLQNIACDSPASKKAVLTTMLRIEPEMNTHFACEEQALFPGVSPYHPMGLMEVEHVELLALRDSLLALLRQQELSAADVSRVQEIGNQFISEMLDHIGREDAGIFPTCEQALSDDEKQVIIAEMDRIREEATASSSSALI